MAIVESVESDRSQSGRSSVAGPRAFRTAAVGGERVQFLRRALRRALCSHRGGTEQHGSVCPPRAIRRALVQRHATLKCRGFVHSVPGLPATAARLGNSDILLVVRISKFLAVFLAAVSLLVFGTLDAAPQPPPQATAAPAQETPAPPAVAPPQAPNPPPVLPPSGPIIVLDPAHGG